MFRMIRVPYEKGHLGRVSFSSPRKSNGAITFSGQFYYILFLRVWFSEPVFLSPNNNFLILHVLVSPHTKNPLNHPRVFVCFPCLTLASTSFAYQSVLTTPTLLFCQRLKNCADPRFVVICLDCINTGYISVKNVK